AGTAAARLPDALLRAVEAGEATVVALRPTARAPVLYEDLERTLTAERSLEAVLTGSGVSDAEMRRVARAFDRDGAPGPRGAGTTVSVRLVPGLPEARIAHLRLAGPDGGSVVLGQVSPGDFGRTRDPWASAPGAQAAAPRGTGRGTGTGTGATRGEALRAALLAWGVDPPTADALLDRVGAIGDLDAAAMPGERAHLVLDTAASASGLDRFLYLGVSGGSAPMACYLLRETLIAGALSCRGRSAGGQVRSAGLGGAMRLPVEGRLASGFGPRAAPMPGASRDHKGVDWGAPPGTPVYAVQEGRVSVAAFQRGYGNVVYIDHGGALETRYAHLERFAQGLSVGQRVAAGHLIGHVGNTGNSTAPHLHFEIRVGGVAVDPMTWQGEDTPVEALVTRIVQVESGGDPNAANPLSSARGLGQFIESTWLHMIETHRPDLLAGRDRRQVLDLRFDAGLSRAMVRQLASDNAAFLRKRGHQVTAGRLYLAHFLGVGGADTALSAPEAQLVRHAFGGHGPAIERANPFLRGWSVGRLQRWADDKMRDIPGGRGTQRVTRDGPPEVGGGHRPRPPPRRGGGGGARGRGASERRRGGGGAGGGRGPP
ncbi:MAG: peptidoglycan DD-metalloendopeptidase family protein, partial [Shimia sp.]